MDLPHEYVTKRKCLVQPPDMVVKPTPSNYADSSWIIDHFWWIQKNGWLYMEMVCEVSWWTGARPTILFSMFDQKICIAQIVAWSLCRMGDCT
jgi:hypothetical protein